MAKTTKVASAQDMRDIYQQLSDELYRTFHFLNAKYAQGKLPTPVITIATAGKAKAHGIFTNSQWKTGETILHEITMCGESLNRPMVEVIETLAHEMAHLDNFVEFGEVKDCTPQQRHNQIFKKKAEAYDLIVTSSKRFGAAHTSASPAFAKMVETELKPKKEVYDIYRANFQENKKEQKKYVSKLKPVMVGEDTKEAIKLGAEEMGMSQKDFAQAAVTVFRELAKNSKTAAELIFEKQGTFKSAAEIEAILADALRPAKEDEVDGSTATEEAE